MPRLLPVITLLLAVPTAALAADGAVAGVRGPVALPWTQGDRIEVDGGAAIVRGVQRKLEFVRLKLGLEPAVAGATGTAVEIRFNSGPPGDYATRSYRVQPAPGVDAHMPTIRAVMKSLRALDVAGHVPFVAVSSGKRKKPVKPASKAPSVEATWTTPAEHGWGRHAGWLALNALALTLMIAILVGTPAPRPMATVRRLGAYVVVGGLLLWLYGTLPPTSLQEGGTGVRIEQLYGHGVHHGPNFTAVMHALTGGEGYGLASLAARNGVLTAIAGLLFAAFASRRLPLAPAAALAAIFALNHTALHTAAAELPSALVVLYATALALALDHGRAAAGPHRARIRGLVLLLVVALTALLWGTRRETAVVGALAIVVIGLRGGFELVPALRRLRTAGMIATDGLPALRPALVAVGVTVTALLVLPAIGERAVSSCSEHWCYLARALIGEELFGSLVWLPGFMVGTALPVGVGAAVVAAMALLLVSPLADFGLPLAALVLYRVYFVAGHGITLEHYELFRYATVFQALWLLAAVGVLARVLAHPRWAGLPRRVRRGVGVAFMVSLALFPATSSDYLPRWPDMLQTNQQRESRTLLAGTRAHPACAFVSAVAAGRVDQPRAELALFGGPDSGISPARYGIGELDRVLGDARHAPCRLFYKGLDCAALGPTCDRFIGSAVERAAASWPSRRYLADHFTRPPATGTLHVGLYDLQAGASR